MLRKRDQIKCLVLILFVIGLVALLLTDHRLSRTALAYSSGPPAGHTGAPGEFTCAECHVPSGPGGGQFTVNAPQAYIPGHTYQITVSHANLNDQSRIRWGFQLTAISDDNAQAGSLQSTDQLTQVLNNQGPGSSRQYIEHTLNGSFFNQHNGASWTFNWTAPQTNVGPVTFYAAGNQANGDDNTSGDFIYTTFVAANPAPPAADFSLTVSPLSQGVLAGNSATYNVTITPLSGFTGQVALSLSGLPGAATASFNPTSVNLNDTSAKTSVLTVTTSSGTPLGTYPLDINATAGSLQHSASTSLAVQNSSSADLVVSNTASPSPATVDATLAYRIFITNNGPANATSVHVSDALPAGVTFVSASPPQGSSCSGTSSINCDLGNLASGQSASVTIVVTPTLVGPLSNTVIVSGNETDPNTGNNSATALVTVEAQASGPRMLDPNLSVRTVAGSLTQPTSMAFLGNTDFLVLEKSTGKVQRIVGGAVQSTVLDLAVNNASERGLLGITLHPNFAGNGFVYLFWTESTTGADSSDLADVALLGNRVDRFIWNGSTLAYDRTLIRLHAFQADANQPLRGNHNGGVMRFGPDGKLYIIMGDNGRRGFLQNIASTPATPDDQFGGPQPDDAHFTGVIIRLNDDGTTPPDNPFFTVGQNLGGQYGANVQKIFAYGIRNSFGMAFDPLSGQLWTEENGDDSFDEINRVEAGFNGGWTEIIGPVSRINEYKAIETSYGSQNLQQLRWPPSLIADSPAEALARLFQLQGSHYTDPEFSWKYAVAPSPIGFVKGTELGAQYEGDLFVGAGRTSLSGGYLFRFKMTGDRQHLAFGDARLSDKVADNLDKFDITESESLLVGRDFGITTDIQTGPNGNLFVVSNSNGAIYEITATPPKLFVARLSGPQEVPSTSSSATGTATLLLSPDETTAKVSLSFSALTSAETTAHIHGPASPGNNAQALFTLPLGQFNNLSINLTPAQVQDLKAGLFYINVHSSQFTGGEIRGQFSSSSAAASFQFDSPSYKVREGDASAIFKVVRYGDLTAAATVDYATSDSAGLNNCNVFNGIASSRCDYTTAVGTLRFAPGESVKQLAIPIIDDVFVEGDETFNLVLSNPTGGAVLGSPSTASFTIQDNDAAPPTSNPVDNTSFFVRQHYIDFLNREPDPPGFAAWTQKINTCPAGDTSCDRIAVSGGIYLSPEFRDRGYFVYKVYEATLARFPHYAEFVQDRAHVSGFQTTAELEQSKLDFINDFMNRTEFHSLYDSQTTARAFVEKVLTMAGVTIANKEDVINRLAAGTMTRAQALKEIVESAEVDARFFNEATIVMHYFGYLRRDPDALYQRWIDTLRTTGSYRDITNGFVNSAEYRFRFGP